MQNLITKTTFQILFTLLCPRIVNYRTEPPRVSYTLINLPQIESDKTLNIHKQMCKFCKTLMYSAFSSLPCPKLGNKFAQKLASNCEVRRFTN